MPLRESGNHWNMPCVRAHSRRDLQRTQRRDRARRPDSHCNCAWLGVRTLYIGLGVGGHREFYSRRRTRCVEPQRSRIFRFEKSSIATTPSDHASMEAAARIDDTLCCAAATTSGAA